MAKDLDFEDALLMDQPFAIVDTAGAGTAPDSDRALVCLTRGTLVECADGPRPVESLRPGDLVRTLDNGLQPVCWTGRRRVAATAETAPVVIAPGVLDNDRALLVSPDLRVMLASFEIELLFSEPEALAPAHALVNDATILRAEAGEVEYIHLHFSRHEIIFAEGQAVESCPPMTDGDSQAAGDRDFEALYPELSMDVGGLGAAARLSLEPHEALVAAAQLGLGYPVTPAPAAPEVFAAAA